LDEIRDVIISTGFVYKTVWALQYFIIDFRDACSVCATVGPTHVTWDRSLRCKLL